MSDAIYELGNGLVINAENPELHSHPGYCVECECFYYFNHICIPKMKKKKRPHTAFKRGQHGYFNGKNDEKN